MLHIEARTPSAKRGRRTWPTPVGNPEHITLDSSGMGAPTIPTSLTINEDDEPSFTSLSENKDGWPKALRGLGLQETETPENKPPPSTAKEKVIFIA